MRIRGRAGSGIAVLALGSVLALVPMTVASAGRAASFDKAHKKGQSPGSPPPCSKIPASVVNTALGTHVANAKGKPGPGSLKNIETCTYSGGAGATLYYAAGTSSQTFKEALSSLSGTTTVKGLGKAAYSEQSSNSDPNQYEVTALFGTLEISITADAPVSAEVSFLKTADAKI
jgi:hypothetical protein